MPTTVRPGTIPDRSALEIIRRQAIEAAFADHYDRGRYADLVARPDPELPTWLREDRYLVLVAETSVTPIAYLACDRETSEILALYTSPDYTGRGHASRLIERAASEFEQSDAMTVWAPEVSRGFFERQGFQDEGISRTDAVPMRRMRKPLDVDR